MINQMRALISTILIVNFLVSSRPIWAATCADLFSKLGSERLTSLEKAEKDDYKVSILSGTVEGQTRTVVLLGETHVKSAKSAKLGKEILRQYQFRGLEGADAEALWGGKVFGWSIHLSHKLGKLLSFGKRNHMSTIDQATKDVLQKQVVALIIKLMEDGKIKRKDIDSKNITIGSKTLTTRQLFEELGFTDGIYEPSFEINVDLETGHKPGLAEQLYSLFFPMMMLTCAGWICSIGLHYLIPENPVGPVLNAITAIISSFSISQYFLSKLPRRWKNSRVYKLVSIIESGSLDGRNMTMVENINRAFLENPEQDTMLVIVGEDHIDGMKQLLSEHFSFSSHDLSELTDGSQ